MKFFILYILFLFYLTPAFSQSPRFTWGDKINRNAGRIENMEIVGVDEDGFFATYEANNQLTLEHYDPKHKSFWTAALLPRTSEGHAATFHSMHMIGGTLYMISSSTGDGETQVYAQQITHNGNYKPEILTLAQGVEGETILVKHAANDAAIAILIAGESRHSITLLTKELTTRWSRSVPSKGEVADLLVQPGGSIYMLTQASAASPSTLAFYLNRFGSKTGRSTEQVLGHTQYRPLKAKLETTPEGSIIVTGYVSPSNSVASQNPEPIGTFLYRFESQNLQDHFSAYTPFDEKFILEYKRFKPDYDNSQRLRHLHLNKVIPLRDGSFYLLGEVYFTEDRAGTFVYHNNDIIVIRLRENGTTAFATSINKLQSGTNKQNTIRSYFATTTGNTLRLLYLNFEYNIQALDEMAMYTPRSALKTPVMVTITPDGTQKVQPLRNTQTGRDHGFYLRPCSAFKISEREYIIIGIGPEFYRYGRMTF